MHRTKQFKQSPEIIRQVMVGASRFERPVRPPHPLGGVATVAPYSSRRHPPAPRRSPSVQPLS
ncbi:MAG: hypothetical protein ABSB22_20380 [Thermodesulfobacteriota bacterium]